MPENRKRRIESIKRTKRERGTKAKSIIEEIEVHHLKVSTAVEGIAVRHQNVPLKMKMMIANIDISGRATDVIRRSNRREGDRDLDLNLGPRAARAAGAIQKGTEVTSGTRTKLESATENLHQLDRIAMTKR